MLLNADVDLERIPRNGIDAYYLVIAKLSAEVEEKSEILAEMQNEDVKRRFISGWTPGTNKVCIHA